MNIYFKFLNDAAVYHVWFEGQDKNKFTLYGREGFRQLHIQCKKLGIVFIELID